MKCIICDKNYGPDSDTPGDCPECLAVIIANAVPDDEEDDRECSQCGQLMRYDPLKNSEMCLDCAYDEPGEPHEPEEGDYITEDDASCSLMTFWEYETRKKLLSVKPDKANWCAAVKAHMDKEQYWPSVWFLSDHGNWHLMQMEAPDNDYVRDRSGK